MAQHRGSEGRIFFPWEARGGLSRWFVLGRLRSIMVVIAVVVVVVGITMRQRRESGLRQTRSTLLDAHRVVNAWMADHDGGCPASLDEAASYGKRGTNLKDAWGHPLRLICPARREGQPYELKSDGSDGIPGGLDRVD